MIESKRKLKLNQLKDWDIWLSIIRVKIIDYQIWNLINSSTEEKSEKKSEFIKSNLNIMSDDIFTEQHVRFKIAQSDYKRKLQEQKKQKKTMKKIISFIYDIINVFNLIYIQKMKIHSWNVLRALQARFTSSNAARNLKLIQQYFRLSRKSISRQNVET